MKKIICLVLSLTMVLSSMGVSCFAMYPYNSISMEEFEEQFKKMQYEHKQDKKKLVEIEKMVNSYFANAEKEQKVNESEGKKLEFLNRRNKVGKSERKKLEVLNRRNKLKDWDKKRRDKMLMEPNNSVNQSWGLKIRQKNQEDILRKLEAYEHKQKEMREKNRIEVDRQMRKLADQPHLMKYNKLFEDIRSIRTVTYNKKKTDNMRFAGRE